MVRFSCFQVQSHSHKHKKTVPGSSEAMQKTLEDSSQNQAPMKNPYMTKENKPCSKKEEREEQNHVFDHATDYSPTASEEIVTKYSTDNDDITAHKKAQIKKSKSVGSGLNWEKTRTPGDDETEQRFSYDGNKKGLGLSPSDQFPEPLPSVSVQVDSDLAKNRSVYSLGESPQPIEKEGADEDDVCLVDSRNLISPRIVRSSSLPRMSSPNRCSTPLVARSRSAEDLNNNIDSRNKVVMHEAENHISVFKNEKNNNENHADEIYEVYNYVGSSRDWIVPASNEANRGKFEVGESSYQNWDEIPAKDFRLRRIEEWVSNLQYCGPMEDSIDEYETTGYDDESPKDHVSLEGPVALNSEVKVSPGMEAAKRYISSLNTSATSAQLTNLGLVVIPFLSAFGSLKALNLSGNAIVRIAAGALPRGLHILNLSRNNISTIEGLRDLARLRVLDLSYNRILRIGHGLAACSSLKELYLAGNKISEVEGLHRLLKLNVLDLRFNKISTAKCLGQLAANYNCLQALSLEGNPAQKNVGDEQLRKYVQSLLPNLTYYNRHSIKAGTTKDAAERSARMGMGGTRPDAKSSRKGAHGISGLRKGGPVGGTRRGQARLPPSGGGVRLGGGQGQGIVDVGGKVTGLSGGEFSFPRSRSEGNLGGL
ncbi:Outer arm dynein light chain 1 protein [Striga hermonthica]|uniref:Outer arm dynein light chain 1 protein n=1 Tax=Striga hermonthica TaxID=68872 RepID=A0A9N7NQW5_STRHE|nr:Outer arm dynein light chain 1 protein [Striga hermonthica]